MKRLCWNWIISSVALWLAALALGRQHVMIHPWYEVLWLAPLLGMINVLVSGVATIVSWIAFPVNLLTLGCFGFILSFIGYALAMYFLGHDPRIYPLFHVASPLWAAALAVVMAIFSSVLNVVLPGKQARARR